MGLEHHLSEIIRLAIVVVAGGAITGILAGLFGIGGGTIIVPVLYEVFRFLEVPEDVRLQLCIGTSLAIVVPTTIRSYLSHRTRGALIRDIVAIWAIPAVLGVTVGSVLAAVAPAAIFKVAFVVIALGLATKMLFGRDRWRIATKLPGLITMRVYGFVLGLLSSLMGIGGGAIVSTILTLYGRSIHEAVAISAGIGVPVSLAGTIGYALAGLPYQASMPPLSIGYVSLIGFALMAPVSTLCAPLGALLAHALPKRYLEIAFGLFLIAVSARFLVALSTSP